MQGSEVAVPLITLARMKEGKRRYREREGADPENIEAPTRAQATAFLAIIDKTDFRVLGFRGLRTARRSLGEGAEI